MGRFKWKSAFDHAFRSSCTCLKYHPLLCSPFILSVVSNDSVSRQWSPWSDCPDAQAALHGHSLSTYAQRNVFIVHGPYYFFSAVVKIWREEAGAWDNHTKHVQWGNVWGSTSRFTAVAGTGLSGTNSDDAKQGKVTVMGKKLTFFLCLRENICYGYSLEAPPCGSFHGEIS